LGHHRKACIQHPDLSERPEIAPQRTCNDGKLTPKVPVRQGAPDAGVMITRWLEGAIDRSGPKRIGICGKSIYDHERLTLMANMTNHYVSFHDQTLA